MISIPIIFLLSLSFLALVPIAAVHAGGTGPGTNNPSENCNYIAYPTGTPCGPFADVYISIAPATANTVIASGTPITIDASWVTSVNNVGPWTGVGIVGEPTAAGCLASAPYYPGSAIVSLPTGTTTYSWTVTPAVGVTYFCVYLVDSGFAPTVSIPNTWGMSDPVPVFVTNGVSDGAPVISPQVGSIEVTSPTMSIMLSWAASLPASAYTYTLYASPTDSCLGPTSSWQLITGPTAATANPQTITFPSVLPGSGTLFLCAVVTDTATGTSLTSGVGTYTEVGPLTSYMNNDESKISIDNGQLVYLTDYVSGGAPPYTYVWWFDGTSATAGCSTGTGAVKIINGGTAGSEPFNATLLYGPSSLFGTGGGPTGYGYTGPGTWYISVFVTDSSIGPSPSTSCETIAITVNPAFTGTFTIDGTSSPQNAQVGSSPYEAVVTFSGGTGPWYDVTIYSGTDSVCKGDTTVVAQASDITANDTILQFPEPSTPSSTTYYCAQLSDSSVGFGLLAGTSTLPYDTPVVLGPIQVTTAPALTAPTMTLSLTSNDFGVPLPVAPSFPFVPALGYYGPSGTNDMATVTWAGGTAPYYVVLTSGSSSSCAAPDNSAVSFALSGIAGHTGGEMYTYPGVSALANLYILQGYDVATTSATSINLYFTAPSTTTYYCAIVFDSSADAVLPFAYGVSQTYTAAGTQFLIEGLLAVNKPALSTYTVEQQSPYYEGNPVTATVTWSGGTGPFTVELFSLPAFISTTNACGTSPWTPVATTPGSNPVTGAASSPVTFSFLAPSVTTLYCATVTDVNGITAGSPIGTGATILTVAPPLSVTPLTQYPTPSPTFYPTSAPTGPDETDTGQVTGITLVASWTGGTAPYTATVFSGSYSNCKLDTTSVASVSGIFGTTATFTFNSPATTTYYCVQVTDSSTPASVGETSNGVVWTVNQAPIVSVTAGAPAFLYKTGIYLISVGQSTTLTAVGSGGSPPLYYQWFLGSGCVAADAVTLPSTSNTYNTGILTATTSYSVQVSDSSIGTPADTACASLTIVVIAGPQSVAVAPALFNGKAYGFGGLVYVTNPDYGVVSVIDSDSNSVVATISAGFPAGFTPWGVAVDPANNVVYVTGQAGTTPSTLYGVVCSIAMATNTVNFCDTLPGGVASYPEGVAVNTALSQAYVADAGLNQVDAFTTPLTMTSTFTTIAVGAAPMNVAVDPNTYTIFVTDNGANTVSVIQPHGGNVFSVTNVAVGFEPYGVAVNPLNDEVWVANSGSATVSVLNGFSYNTIATIKLVDTPTGVTIDTASNTAYVANMDGTVTPINMATFTPSTAIGVGLGAAGIASFLSPFAGIASLAYVANSGTNTVSVINLATNQVIATIAVP